MVCPHATLPETSRPEMDAPVEKIASLRARMSDDVVDDGILALAAGLQWYALLVPPQREFIAQKILRRYGLRTYVPVRRSWRRTSKFKADKVLAAFPASPRYVFAGFEPGRPLWFKLFDLPNIAGVVSIRGRPLLLPASEMVRMIRHLGTGLNEADTDRFLLKTVAFAAGDLVDVISGPFEGLQVPVVSVGGNKAKVLLKLFGGAVEGVEIPLDDLKAA